jgi:hypothetical protein
MMSRFLRHHETHKLETDPNILGDISFGVVYIAYASIEIMGLLGLLPEGKLEPRATHQLTLRIVLCMRDDLEVPEAPMAVDNKSTRPGKQP